MSSPQGHIKKEFFIFAENISVKGVSRILKAKNIVYRVLWSMAVVISLCILLWQLSIVFMKYFTWPVDTVIEESSEQPRFPDVTICNIQPNYDLESMSEKISWFDYVSVLVRLIYIDEDFIKQKKHSQEFFMLIDHFYSRTGYILNFPIIDENITFDDQLIKFYQAYNWQWQEIKSKTCKPIIKYQWDPNYYACRTLRVPEECQGHIRGISLILYIYNFPEMLQLRYRPGFLSSQATGALAIIHAPGTLPNLKMAHLFGPGTENNIRLSPVIRSRLPSPYSDCTNQKYIHSKTEKITEKKLLYTKDVCIDVCFQQQALDKCGCLNSAFLFTPEQNYEANGKVCGNLSLLENISIESIDKGFRDILCSLTIPMDLEICEGECKNHCEEVSYDLTMSSVPWPDVAVHLGFATALGLNKDQYGSKFDIYQRIFDDLTRDNVSNTIHQLETVDLIEKNFLRMNIFFEGYTALVLKDVPSLTTDKMLGIIGGGLSLWLGISIMTLVEVFEFVCKLVHLYIQKNRRTERPAVQLDEPVTVGETPS